MRQSILFVMGAAIILAGASAASAQGVPPGGPPAGAGNMGGGPRVQDIAATNRQQDADYNTLAGRGIKVTNEDRANTPRPVKPGIIGPATAADVKPGAPVRDIKGVPVGTIATLAANEVAPDPNMAVIDTGQTKIGVPLSAFGKDGKGLLLSITAEKFDQLVAQARSKPGSTSSN